MNILHKRPLATILFVLTGGFSVFAVSGGVFSVVLFSIAFLLVIFSFTHKFFSGVFPKIICVSLLLSFVLSSFYFNLVFYPKDYIGDECQVVGVVDDLEIKSDYYRIAHVKTESINGKSGTYNIITYIYGFNDEVVMGSRLSFTSEISELNSGSGLDFKQYYSALGISATASPDDVEIIGFENPGVKYEAESIRNKLVERATKLSDNKTSAMLGALLLGERNLLSGQVKLDFQRIGITHILSLSGMHLAMLMGGLDRLLYLLRFKKSLRILTGCIFSFAFMALTGFPVTVCRAGFMLIVSSLIYLITGYKDAITSLFIAGFLIILISPHAALDIGLWLSLLATLGILVIVDMLSDEYKEKRFLSKAFGAITLSLVFSIFSISATAAITALNFNGISTLSIISTAIFSPIIELFVYLGIGLLVFGDIIPLGAPLIKLGSFIENFAGILSDVEVSFASSDFVFVKILLIISTIAFTVFSLATIKRKKIFIALISFLIIFSSLSALILTDVVNSHESIISYSENGEDNILIKNEGTVILFDSSSHKRSVAYKNNDLLTNENITDIDYYVCADYGYYLPESIEIMLTYNKIDCVLVPAPKNEYEESIFDNVSRVMSDFRAELGCYNDLEIINLGPIEMLVPFRAYEHNSFAFTFKVCNEIISYISSGALEHIFYSDELLYVSDYLIFGDHGDSYTDKFYIDEVGNNVSKIIIYDDKIIPDLRYMKDKLPTVIDVGSRIIIK